MYNNINHGIYVNNKTVLEAHSLWHCIFYRKPEVLKVFREMGHGQCLHEYPCEHANELLCFVEE